jgi:ubiquinol-cytochrome c reductase subunit 6
MNSITDFLSSFLPVIQADAPEENTEEKQQPKAEESEEKPEEPAEEEEDEPEDVYFVSKFL